MAVTINYEYPVAGATPPTAAQVKRVSSVVAEIQATADADVLATITHNMAITAQELLDGWPIINTEILLPEGWVSTPHVLAAGKLTNSVAVTMSAGVGSGAATPQLRVTMLRPNTIIR